MLYRPEDKWTRVSDDLVGVEYTLLGKRILTSAEILALNTTALQIAPAPGAARAYVPVVATWAKPAGTAYGGIAAGEDLAIKYTGSAGVAVIVQTSTGFLDQATAQVRATFASSAAATGMFSTTPVANAPLFVHLLAGAITTGNTTLTVSVYGYKIPTT